MNPAHPERTSLAVCLLAGGEATRFPGKLESDAGGVPLLERVYENLRSIAPVTVSAKDGFSADLKAALACPIVVDRWARRGPLAGLLSTLPMLDADRVFVAAGDLPFVDAQVYARLNRAWTNDTQAAVPVHGSNDRIEPLCALYDRAAFLEAAYPIFTNGSGSVREVVERLRVVRVRFEDGRVFANVNTALDRRTLFHR
ncbi:MAG: molybdenum cofactor guanylyltransferase [Candidatus Eremiobacteraeota bacterium]|nr:molybdenum cofactor guanylyltransferase [Candidatus Eremiobacteraeota bacterium]